MAKVTFSGLIFLLTDVQSCDIIEPYIEGGIIMKVQVTDKNTRLIFENVYPFIRGASQ